MAASSESSSQVFAKSGIFTCIYTSIIIFYSVHLSDSYNFCTTPLICVFLTAEVVKYIWLSPTIKEDKVSRAKDKPKEFFKCGALVALLTTIYYVISVLFGAPILELQEDTLRFALLMATLTTVPLCLAFGYNTTSIALLELTTRNPDSRLGIYQRGVCLVIFGAWLGAVVIPLDWDRPWQQWPIPCSAGAVFALLYDGVLNAASCLPKFNRPFNDNTGKYGL